MSGSRVGLLGMVLLGALAISSIAPACAGQRVPGWVAPPVSGVLNAKGETPVAGLPLTSGELAVLQARQAQDGELLDESGAGCRSVWNNKKQQSEIQCADPLGFELPLGLLGAVVGAGWNGLASASVKMANAAIGGVIGFVLGYAYYEYLGYK